jgi:hypothetical protein
MKKTRLVLKKSVKRFLKKVMVYSLSILAFSGMINYLSSTKLELNEASEQKYQTVVANQKQLGNKLLMQTSSKKD